ncbi:MAG: hypothetical protein ABWX69_03105 [Arthrobacter sp.]
MVLMIDLRSGYTAPEGRGRTPGLDVTYFTVIFGGRFGNINAPGAA